MTKEEKMNNVIRYAKDYFPPVIQSFYNNIGPFYKNLEVDINKCAITQRNWRMYLVNLGGNGRHRNIRKTIRLMNSNKNVLGDVINTKAKNAMKYRIKEKLRSPLYDWIMRMHISDKGMK